MASVREWVDIAEVLTGISAIIALFFSYKAYHLTRRDFQLNLEPLLFTPNRNVQLPIVLTHSFQGRSQYHVQADEDGQWDFVTNLGNRPALNTTAVFQVDWTSRWGNASDHIRVPDRMFLVALDRNFLNRDDRVRFSVLEILQLADHANQAQLIGGRLFLRYEDLAGQIYCSCLHVEVRKVLLPEASTDGPFQLSLHYPHIHRLRQVPPEPAEYLRTYSRQQQSDRPHNQVRNRKAFRSWI